MTTLVADLKNWADNGWTNSAEWSEENECYNDPQAIAIMKRDYYERLHELVDKKNDEDEEAARSMMGFAEDKDGTNTSSKDKEAADIPDDD